MIIETINVSYSAETTLFKSRLSWVSSPSVANKLHFFMHTLKDFLLPFKKIL